MKSRNAKKILFVVKIINLDIKKFADKTIIASIFEIDGCAIHMVRTLINQKTIVLFQILLLGLKIWCLRIVLNFLGSCLINIVTK